MNINYVLTCEHASNKVPKAYQHLIPEYWLQTHHGYDKGAIDCWRYLQRYLPGYSHCAKYSRLLIDMNRSLTHPRLFSKYLLCLSHDERQRLITRYYHPYRDAVKAQIQKMNTQNEVVFHFSIHSFTPVLQGHTRRVDIGLLYDPKREREKALCVRMQKHLQESTGKRVKLNTPYSGASDGFTTHCRTRFPSSKYIGIEIELNQRLFYSNRASQLALFAAILNAIQQYT